MVFFVAAEVFMGENEKYLILTYKMKAQKITLKSIG